MKSPKDLAIIKLKNQIEETWLGLLMTSVLNWLLFIFFYKQYLIFAILIQIAIGYVVAKMIYESKRRITEILKIPVDIKLVQPQKDLTYKNIVSQIEVLVQEIKSLQDNQIQKKILDNLKKIENTNKTEIKLIKAKVNQLNSLISSIDTKITEIKNEDRGAVFMSTPVQARPLSVPFEAARVATATIPLTHLTHLQTGKLKKVKIIKKGKKRSEDKRSVK